MDKTTALAEIDDVLATRPEGGGSAMVVKRVAHYYPCICRWAPLGSSYRQLAEQWRSAPVKGPNAHVSPDGALRGVLESLRRDIDKDRLRTFEEQVHGDVFSDFLAQAAHLSNEGYRRAAAVLAGGALEEHLRQLGRKNSIATVDAKGAPHRASTLNNELKKAAVYGEPDRAEVESWLKRRNAAAHGNPDFESNHDTNDIRRMVDGIRSLLVKYPA